ncbi:MAG TPA: type I methionyl aminopeptidase [Nocardioidaceae bacterium]|nr:type I methionyl aminopeptidase [Nocardioidaceae bacterium]
MFQNRAIEVKTPEQIAQMRRAGLVVAETLDLLRSAVAPGVTTRELDSIAAAHLAGRGATSNFLGYRGYPATICTSVDDVVVHGIPGERQLREGDLVSIDCGAIVAGWHGDAAVTVAVGKAAPVHLELMAVCEEALWRGIAAARVGGRVGDISAAVESHVRAQGDYGIVEEYVGHGIGSAMHMAPNVPNVGRAGKGPRLVAGMALAVEPMVTLGGIDTEVLDDDWTVVSSDGAWSAHFEHSFALTDRGLVVLTAMDGGAARLAELGVPCAVS